MTPGAVAQWALGAVAGLFMLILTFYLNSTRQELADIQIRLTYIAAVQVRMEEQFRSLEKTMPEFFHRQNDTGREWTLSSTRLAILETQMLAIREQLREVATALRPRRDEPSPVHDPYPLSQRQGR